MSLHERASGSTILCKLDLIYKNHNMDQNVRQYLRWPDCARGRETVILPDRRTILVLEESRLIW